MRLQEVSLDESPLGKGRIRLTGKYCFGTGGRERDQLWFDVPPHLADALSTSGNPWLACLLPMAVSLNEPLELCRPIDAGLHEGAVALMQTWSGCYPAASYRRVPIVADILPPSPPLPGGKTVQFFTGGIDSFFTLLRHAPDGGAIDRRHIDELLTIWGLDIPLDAPEAFTRVAARIASVAESAGLSSAVMATNLRESSWRVTHWGNIGQGPALAGMALALERRYRHALLPASVTYSVYLPYGTHPLFDPLLSTSGMRFEDDGAQWTRREKLAQIMSSDLAMTQLRVCWEGRSDANCGRCEKCLRTIAMLEMLGARERAVTFPPDAWSLRALGELRLRNDTACWSMADLARQAAAAGHPAIAAAARKAVSRYQRRRSIGRLLRRLRRSP